MITTNDQDDDCIKSTKISVVISADIVNFLPWSSSQGFRLCSQGPKVNPPLSIQLFPIVYFQ